MLLLQRLGAARDLIGQTGQLRVVILPVVDGLDLLGGVENGLHLLLHAGARLAGRSLQFTRHLALCLVPTGAAGLFLGLSATTVKLLRYEGLALLWVQPARAALLLAAIAWCLWLSERVCASLPAGRKAFLLLSMALACSLPGYAWWLQFWGW